jgi:hypothetical protein
VNQKLVYKSQEPESASSTVPVTSVPQQQTKTTLFTTKKKAKVTQPETRGPNQYLTNNIKITENSV